MAKSGIVGIVAEHDLIDSALAEFVRSLGYRAVVVDLDLPQPAVTEPLRAVVVRTGRRLTQAALDPRCAGAAVAVLESADSLRVGRGAGIVIPASDRAVGRLAGFLEDVLGAPHRPGAVSLSRREREVLTTYVLGATVEKTAEEHFVATSTVRTHYRRVTARYTRAGRSVTNKAQLLLQMVADGWIRLPDSVPASDEGSDAGAA